MEIYDAKVNHLKNPLGFSMEKLSFSWKVKAARGTRQQAARIRIATDAAFTDILNDTGYQEQADSLGTEVALDLKPCTRYYWTVTVRDDADGEASSVAQWFETAKRGSRGWGNGSPATAKTRGIRFSKRRFGRRGRWSRRVCIFAGLDFTRRITTAKKSEMNT